MAKLKLNNTPVRTSRNFNINNIEIDQEEIEKVIGEFNNLKIIGENDNIKISKNISNSKLTYGIFSNLENQSSNQNINIDIYGKDKKELILDFEFDENNLQLVENIEINANENSKSTVILKYHSEDNKAFHNGRIIVNSKENSEINVIIVNFMGDNSNNFISIENKIEKTAKCNYKIIDFGGKHSITNYYSNLEGDNCENIVNTIFLGNKNQIFDLNYIGELKGKKSNIDIDIQGALNDSAKKHFKGTIDFKKGSKKAKGNENEFCLLLSDKAKSIALPMLLCSEEDVEGNHSTAAGKTDAKQLFYIMSRGFSYKEAMKLIVKARFNNVIEQIENPELKMKILNKIEEKLD